MPDRASRYLELFLFLDLLQKWDNRNHRAQPGPPLVLTEPTSWKCRSMPPPAPMCRLWRGKTGDPPP